MRTLIRMAITRWAKARVRALSFAPGHKTLSVIECLERLCTVLREQLADGEWTTRERDVFVTASVGAIDRAIREAQDA